MRIIRSLIIHVYKLFEKLNMEIEPLLELGICVSPTVLVGNLNINVPKAYEIIEEFKASRSLQSDYSYAYCIRGEYNGSLTIAIVAEDTLSSSAFQSIECTQLFSVQKPAILNSKSFYEQLQGADTSIIHKALSSNVDVLPFFNNLATINFPCISAWCKE